MVRANIGPDIYPLFWASQGRLDSGPYPEIPARGGYMRLSMLPCHPAFRAGPSGIPTACKETRARKSQMARVLCSLLVAVIGVEPIALIVLDAPQRRGI